MHYAPTKWMSCFVWMLELKSYRFSTTRFPRSPISRTIGHHGATDYTLVYTHSHTHNNTRHNVCAWRQTMRDDKVEKYPIPTTLRALYNVNMMCKLDIWVIRCFVRYGVISSEACGISVRFAGDNWVVKSSTKRKRFERTPRVCFVYRGAYYVCVWAVTTPNALCAESIGAFPSHCASSRARGSLEHVNFVTHIKIEHIDACDRIQWLCVDTSAAASNKRKFPAEGCREFWEIPTVRD